MNLKDTILILVLIGAWVFVSYLLLRDPKEIPVISNADSDRIALLEEKVLVAEKKIEVLQKLQRELSDMMINNSKP